MTTGKVTDKIVQGRSVTISMRFENALYKRLIAAYERNPNAVVREKVRPGREPRTLHTRFMKQLLDERLQQLENGNGYVDAKTDSAGA